MSEASQRKPVTDLEFQPEVSPTTLSPDKLLFFAGGILLGACLLLIGAVIVYLKYPGSKEAESVYETAKTGLLPIITLVLGFYFGGKR